MRVSTPKTGDWLDHEVDIEAFGDKRLGKRLRRRLQSIQNRSPHRLHMGYAGRSTFPTLASND